MELVRRFVGRVGGGYFQCSGWMGVIAPPVADGCGGAAGMPAGRDARDGGGSRSLSALRAWAGVSFVVSERRRWTCPGVTT